MPLTGCTGRTNSAGVGLAFQVSKPIVHQGWGALRATVSSCVGDLHYGIHDTRQRPLQQFLSLNLLNALRLTKTPYQQFHRFEPDLTQIKYRT